MVHIDNTETIIPGSCACICTPRLPPTSSESVGVVVSTYESSLIVCWVFNQVSIKKCN